MSINVFCPVETTPDYLWIEYTLTWTQMTMINFNHNPMGYFYHGSKRSKVFLLNFQKMLAVRVSMPGFEPGTFGLSVPLDQLTTYMCVSYPGKGHFLMPDRICLITLKLPRGTWLYSAGLNSFTLCPCKIACNFWPTQS